MTGLTPRRLDILRAIAELQKEGQPADMRALVKAVGLARETSVAVHTKPLVEKGYVLQHGGKDSRTGSWRTRFFTLTPRGEKAAGVHRGLLFHSATIAAGLPCDAVEDTVAYIDTIEQLFNIGSQEVKLIPVKGDSMNGGPSPIQADDIAVIYREEPHNGSIVAAQIVDPSGYKWALKVYYRSNDGTLILYSSNPDQDTYKPLILSKEPLSDSKIETLFRRVVRKPAPISGVYTLAPETVIIEWVWKGQLVRGAYRPKSA